MNDPLTGRTAGGGGVGTGFAAPGANSVNLGPATEGVATTVLRSDATFEIDESIVPNWTGRHDWTIATAAGFTNAGEYALRLNTSAVATAINTDYPSPFLTFKNSYWDGAAAQYDLGIIGLTSSIGSSSSAMVMGMQGGLGFITVEKDGKMFFIQGTFGANTSHYNFGADSATSGGEAELLRLMNGYVGTTDGVAASMLFDVRNDANVQKTIGKLKFTCDDVSDTTEDSSFSVWTQVAGTLTKVWEVTAANTLSSLAIAQGTITNPANALSITGTWNDAADTFVGVLWNFTSTASAAASKICDFQIGGVSRWNLRKDGILTHTGSGGSTFTVDPDTAALNHSAGYIASNNCLRLTTGAKTVSDPVLDATQTWNSGAVTFTGLKLNVTDTASAAASLLMDLQVGGSSKASVRKDGLVSSFAGFAYYSNTYSDRVSLNGDTILVRDAAAAFQMGNDAATAIAQTLKAHDGSGTDKDGADFRLCGGQPTGTGRGGAFITRTGLTGTTGSTAGSYTNRSYASAKHVTLTESAATTFCNIALGAAKHIGARLICTVFASDGTDHQSLTTELTVDAVNKAGTVTPTIASNAGTTAASAGTLTCTYTVVASGNSVDIKANAASSLSQTTLQIQWMIVALNSNDTAAITAS